MKNYILRRYISIAIILCIFLSGILGLIYVNKLKTAHNPESIRDTKFAGTWYPSDNRTCIEEIDRLISEIKPQYIKDLRAVIVPHAAWRWSGKVAAGAYAEINDDFDRVILIGPSHKSMYSGASLPNYTYFSTPMGKIRVSDAISSLSLNALFDISSVHDNEHSLEVQLPFLQKRLSKFEILPIIIGPLTGQDELKIIAKALVPYVTSRTLIVVSSDLTHYGPDYQYTPFKDVSGDVYNETNTYIANKLLVLDSRAVEFIVNMDPEGFMDFCDNTGVTICGKKPIDVLLNILDSLSHHGNEYKIIPMYYDTSGRTSGDYTNSVSYASIAISEIKLVNDSTGTENTNNINNNNNTNYNNNNDNTNAGTEGIETPLTNDEQKLLLSLARSALEQHLVAGTQPDVDVRFLSESLKTVQGCFTTLNTPDISGKEKLRGCIGHILPQEELYKCVMDNAVNAGVNDNRFEPVTYDEVKRLNIEISVLSVPEKLVYDGPEDLLTKLHPNIDGVVIKKGLKSATYLPQVWKQLPDKQKFLDSLCIKAGLAGGCWKENIEVQTYRAFVFSESEQ
ncbi:AmmeMemoRadiSam system protein B [Candidatus Woesearchaeota archaeon]|nr:AmmeMemoRadiSam system protein B [Candidatus Woesearchaeota archaeon]